MGIYLKIGGIDVSRFITVNRYSVQRSPVYDEAGAFVNIYGEKIKRMTGRRVTIKAVLSDVDDRTAAALDSVLDGESVTAEYSAPGICEGQFKTVSFMLSLDRVFGQEKFWTAQMELCSEFIPEDGL